MITVEKKTKDLLLKLLTKIDEYDIIYVVDLDKLTGIEFILDDYNIYYINPRQTVKYEIAIELAQNTRVNKLAIINAHHLQIKQIKDLKDLPFDVDFYSLWADKHHNIYSSSKYLLSNITKEIEEG